jgi:hypothetical protein
MARKMIGASFADFEIWRVPDEEGEEWAVWYGPEGPEGDVASAVARTGSYQYRFAEIQNVVGLIDEPEEDFLVTAVTIDLDDAAQKPLRIDGEEARRRLDQMPEEKKLRLAAAFASDMIPRLGGEESWAETLADGIAEIV